MAHVLPVIDGCKLYGSSVEDKGYKGPVSETFEVLRTEEAMAAWAGVAERECWSHATLSSRNSTDNCGKQAVLHFS